MRTNYYEFPKGTSDRILIENGCTSDNRIRIVVRISDVKRLIRTHGGKGWVEYTGRDGKVYETTEIALKGNNVFLQKLTEAQQKVMERLSKTIEAISRYETFEELFVNSKGEQDYLETAASCDTGCETPEKYRMKDPENWAKLERAFIEVRDEKTMFVYAKTETLQTLEKLGYIKVLKAATHVRDFDKVKVLRWDHCIGSEQWRKVCGYEVHVGDSGCVDKIYSEKAGEYYTPYIRSKGSMHNACNELTIRAFRDRLKRGSIKLERR